MRFPTQNSERKNKDNGRMIAVRWKGGELEDVNI
jgi:hypothetical protein